MPRAATFRITAQVHGEDKAGATALAEAKCYDGMRHAGNAILSALDADRSAVAARLAASVALMTVYRAAACQTSRTPLAMSSTQLGEDERIVPGTLSEHGGGNRFPEPSRHYARALASRL